MNWARGSVVVKALPLIGEVFKYLVSWRNCDAQEINLHI
jgi:hypothetical protein